MANVKLTFEYADKTIRDPLYLGTFSGNDEGQIFPIRIKHNSNKPIKECSFFVSPYDQIYDGTNSPLKDYDLISWYADNYEGSGLKIYQEYEIYGDIYRQESKRLIDISRKEEKDFMTGYEIEILSGPVAGEKRTVISYDQRNCMFILNEDFSIPVDGQKYKISMKKTDFIKGKSGTSPDYAIPLLYNGGKIDRFESATIYLQMTAPAFIKQPGINHINFNMKFTPEE